MEKCLRGSSLGNMVWLMESLKKMSCTLLPQDTIRGRSSQDTTQEMMMKEIEIKKRPRARSFIGKMSNWMENRGKNKDNYSERGRDPGWFRGESSRGRTRAVISLSPPPFRNTPLLDERRALRMLWQSKGPKPVDIEEDDAIEVIETTNQAMQYSLPLWS
jgi:hypothetical protein